MRWKLTIVFGNGLVSVEHYCLLIINVAVEDSIGVTVLEWEKDLFFDNSEENCADNKCGTDVTK